jgi:hypothetical protein
MDEQSDDANRAEPLLTHPATQCGSKSARRSTPACLTGRIEWQGRSSRVERSLTVLADYIGPHKIMWATDYPHSDGFFPGHRVIISPL